MSNQPLAERIRPKNLSEFIGQQQVLGPDSPLRAVLAGEKLASMILYGPPGCGKTTLARMIAGSNSAEFVSMSALDSGVAAVREVISAAKKLRELYDRPTVLFLDEIHRFSKSQQDSLLASVESGIIYLIAATTENPSFSVIPALISRCILVPLKPLTEQEIAAVVSQALKTQVKDLKITDAALEQIAKLSGGDARRALNLFELASEQNNPVTIESVTAVQSSLALRYDKTGDQHYDTISAFIKSVRGSDVSSALHYLAVMIEAGEDPRFIARRLVILASEDIGLADPNALNLAVSTLQAVSEIGMPEGRIPLSQCTIMLALSPKSNTAYNAINQAIADVRGGKQLAIPNHLLSSSKNSGEYLYPHDYAAGIVSQKYSSETLPDYYKPGAHGFEATLQQRKKAVAEILKDSKE